MDSPIQITQDAAKQMEVLLAKAPEGTQGLRLNVKTTGCSGNSYSMEYVRGDDDMSADERFEDSKTAIYVPKIYSWMLFGVTVDYVSDELGNSRFDFINPNETGRCGCGESFQIEKKPD